MNINKNKYKNADGSPNKKKMIMAAISSGLIKIEPSWAKKYLLPEMFKTGKSPEELIYDYYNGNLTNIS